jgi:osmoprotectant transport system ATP-binding protein
LLGLEPTLRERYPHQLSGGQQQRVGVARALAANPEVLLMDEPFGALDPVTREALQQEMIRIHRLLGRTIVLVTHDIDEALRLADHLVLMDGGEVVQQGRRCRCCWSRKMRLWRRSLAAANWACACCRCAAWATICAAMSAWRATR